MDVIRAVEEVRLKTNDRDGVGVDDQEILSYLNEAIQVVSQFMIGAGSPLLVQDMNIGENDGTEIDMPPNFIRFCGTFPVRITGKKFNLLEDPPMKLRYYVSYPIVEMDDEMPFHHDELNQIAVRLACIYVNNQQELDVQQDQALLAEIQNSILAAMKQAQAQ